MRRRSLYAGLALIVAGAIISWNFLRLVQAYMARPEVSDANGGLYLGNYFLHATRLEAAAASSVGIILAIAGLVVLVAGRRRPLSTVTSTQAR
jgi:hypothetical protein